MIIIGIQDPWDEEKMIESDSNSNKNFLSPDNYPEKEHPISINDKYRIISDNTTDFISIISFSEDPVYTYVNSRYKKMLGFDPEEMIGKQVSDFLHPDDKAPMTDLIKKYLSMDNENEQKNTEQFLIRMCDKSGKWHFLEVTSNLVGNQIINVAKDITEYKKREDELRDKSEELEMMNRELLVLREQLTDINDNLEYKVQERTKEVEKLLKQKDLFITQLDHDLRTPLTPLLNLIPILKRRIDDPKSTEIFQVIQTAINRLNSVVKKTSRFVYYNAPSTIIQLDEFNLFDLIEEILHKMNIDPAIYQIRNNIDKQLQIVADKNMIAELFENILDNAVKFNMGDNEIALEAKTTYEHIIISIKDTGIGINEEQLSNIFEPFYKADESRHDLESHGVGLALCKLIVEKNYGTIWAESEGLDKGSTFYVSLPDKTNLKKLYNSKLVSLSNYMKNCQEK